MATRKRGNIERHDETTKLLRGWHIEQHYGQSVAVRDGYVAVKCDGEAHGNPHIDYCGLCAPLWGIRAIPQ